jgi:hypothetical protein
LCCLNIAMTDKRWTCRGGGFDPYSLSVGFVMGIHAGLDFFKSSVPVAKHSPFCLHILSCLQPLDAGWMEVSGRSDHVLGRYSRRIRPFANWLERASAKEGRAVNSNNAINPKVGWKLCPDASLSSFGFAAKIDAIEEQAGLTGFSLTP